MGAELTEALTKVQAALPQIRKGETAKVETSKGSYSYTYADLASVSAALLPLLADHGFAFVAKPTVTDTGAFVLAYSLMHVSGEREDGSYPLPTNGTPQQVGSAITYARRYVLCAVTGVAPEDDDGQAAEQAARQAPAAAPQGKPSPTQRVDAYLKKNGIPPAALTAYLGAEHGVERFAELSEQHQEAVADGLEKSILGDRLKELAKDAKALRAHRTSSAGDKGQAPVSPAEDTDSRGGPSAVVQAPKPVGETTAGAQAAPPPPSLAKDSA